MISGIGCDIADIARIKKVCLRQPKFCETVPELSSPFGVVRRGLKKGDIAISCKPLGSKRSILKSAWYRISRSRNLFDISILTQRARRIHVQPSGKVVVQIKNQRLKCHASLAVRHGFVSNGDESGLKRNKPWFHLSSRTSRS